MRTTLYQTFVLSGSFQESVFALNKFVCSLHRRTLLDLF